MATLGDMMNRRVTVPGADTLGGVTPQWNVGTPTTLGDAIKNPGGMKTWQKVVGVLGDALTAYSGGQGMFLPQALAQRQREQEFQQAFDLAERKGQLDQQKFIAGKQWERDNPAPTEMQRNYEWLGRVNPAAQDNYIQRQTDNTQWRQGPDGKWYRIDNSPLPTRPVGKLTPITPTMANTPSPELSANGMPTALTRDQYQVVVNKMGKAATDAWMARNNITIGGR